MLASGPPFAASTKAGLLFRRLSRTFATFVDPAPVNSGEISSVQADLLCPVEPPSTGPYSSRSDLSALSGRRSIRPYWVLTDPQKH